MHVILREISLSEFRTGVPAYRAIRRAFVRARITIAAPKIFAPLAERKGVGVIDDSANTQGRAPLPPQMSEADLRIDRYEKGPDSHRLLLHARLGRLLAFGQSAIPRRANGPTPRPLHRDVWHGTTENPQSECIDPGLAAIDVPRVLAELAALPA